MKTGLTHKLRVKIALIVLFVGIIPLLVCVPISIRAYKTVSLRYDGQSMMAQALQYNDQIVSTGFLDDAKNEHMQDLFDAIAESYHGRVFAINLGLRVIYDSYGADEGKTVVWENAVRTLHGESLYYFDKKNNYLIVTVPVTTTNGDIVGALVLNKSMDYLDSNTDIFVSYWLIAAVIIVALTIFVAVFFAISYTKPLKAMSRSLDNITEDYTNLLPEEKSYEELEKIGQKFNIILQKLHDIDVSRQEFVSNVSHELKTPLTSMKVLADSLNGSEDVPLDMYKEFMSDIGDEIERETKIINDLLSLVRMDKSGAELNVAAVNINELIDHILKRLKPIAEKADVEVVFESFRPVIAEVDEVKFTLVITNLVENAIKYNNEGGWVHITLNSDHQYCYIKVQDNGLGIPEDSVEHIFERFYRADKSHSREIGGTGLGLAITKSAVAMHRGSIKVHSALGEGSTFDVRVPLSYIQEESL